MCVDVAANGVLAPSNTFTAVYDPTGVNTVLSVRVSAPSGMLYVQTAQTGALATSSVLKTDTGAWVPLHFIHCLTPWVQLAAPCTCTHT